MKKTFLILPLILGLVYIITTGYSGGYAASTGADRTGATSSSSGCGGSGCHGSSATSAIGVTLSLIDSSGATVTRYTPGRPYHIKVSGVNNITGSSTSLSKFGFMLSAVALSGSGTSSAHDLGTFGSSLPTYCQNTTISSSHHVIEHSRAITSTTGSGSGGGATTYVELIPWTAPSAGSGSVKLYAALNAVNADGSATSTDKYNVGFDTVFEATTSGIPAITGTTTVCAGSTTALRDSVTGGSWSSVTTSVATVSGDGTVYGVSSGTSVISYSTSSGTATTTVTVLPRTYVGSISGATSVCAGSTITLVDSTSGGTWSSSSSSIASVSSGGVVRGNAAGTVTISYSVSGTCGTAVATHTVTVGGAPYVASMSGPSSVCIGSYVTMIDSTSGGTWSVSHPSMATVTSGGVVYGLSTGVDTIKYTVTSSCGTTVVSRPISVNAVPSAGSIGGPTTVCVGGMITITDSIAGGSWSSSSLAIATVGASSGSGASVYGVSVGTDVITYTVSSGGCSGIATRTITVTTGSTSAGTISGSSGVCIGNTITLVDSITGGVWSTGASSIATVNSGTGVVTGVSAGTVIITYAVTGSCGTAFSTHSVTVITPPSAGTISGATTVCVGSSAVLVDSTVSGGVTWTSSNPSVATVSAGGTVIGLSTGSVTITVTEGTTCGSAFATHAMTVISTPYAGSLSGPSTVCTGSSITLTDSVTGGSWSSSNTSVATVGTSFLQVFGVAAGTSTISYVVSNSCGTAVATKMITVTGAASVSAITGTSTVCSSATIALSDATTGGVWTSSNAGVATVNSSTGIVSGVSAGSVTISYSVAGSCGTGVATKAITVISAPLAGSISGASTVCAGSSVTFSDSISGGTWSSSSSIATVSGSGVVFGLTAGTATISYAVTNSCGTTVATHAIVVNPLPSTPAAITGSATACTGAVTTLTDATAGGVWTSSNTTIATVNSTGGVTGVTPGGVTISYTVTNSCGSASVILALSVNPSPTAGTISGATTVCQGSTTTFTDGVSGGTWSSSNSAVANVATSGVVSGISTGTATITYTVTNSCGTARATKSITVNPLPSAGTISGPSTACTGSIITLTDGTSGGTWVSGNTAIATVNTAGVVTPVANGTVSIKYIASNSCGFDTASFSLTVNSLPSAGTVTGPTIVCVGSGITLTDAVTGGTWTSSNTSIATVSGTGVVTGMAIGTAAISYSVTSSCGTAVTAAVISVGTLPSAGTITGASGVCTGSTITLTDAVTGGSWLSSNTSIATVNSATGVVTGVAVGTVTISYYVSSSCATAFATSAITVSASATAGTITGLATVCAGSNITLTDAVAGGTWSSSNVARATVTATGVVRGVSSGSLLISYTVAAGCGTVVATKAITVSPLATVGGITGASSVCAGSTITLGDSVSGGGWISSNTSIATVNASGLVTGIAVGSATITYFVSSACGTSATTKTITVNSLSAGLLGGVTSVAVGAAITLTSTVTGGTWSSTNTALATVTTAGVVTGVAVGVDTIRYSITNSCGTATANKVITISAHRSEEPAVTATQEEAGNVSVNIYPNPNSGAFTIDIAGNNGNASILISDIAGRVVDMKTTDGQSIYINAAQYAAGTYLVRVSANGKVFSQKVIVQ